MSTPTLEDNELLFEQAKTYLMQANDSGESVYDLLYKTVYSMMEENPEDIANNPDRFNDVLSIIKKNQFSCVDTPAAAIHPDVRENGPVPHTISEAANKNIELLQRPADEMKTTVEKPSPFTTVTTTTIVRPKGPAFRSVAKDNVMWKFCGVGLPSEEAFLIDQSIAMLVREKSLENVRFMGKIFGTSGNYLVLTSKRYVSEDGGETILKETYNMPKPTRRNTSVPVQPEPGFVGCNRLTFWVAKDASSEWIPLADTTPDLINAARTCKKMFTGVLTTPIVSHPPFPAGTTEAEYLRAQLSRILSGCYICPVGALEAPEEEDLDDVDDDGNIIPKPAKYIPFAVESKEYQPDGEEGVAGLVDLDQWVHAEGYIYKNGRQTKIPPKPEEDEEEVEENDEEKYVDSDEQERQINGQNPLLAGTYDPDVELALEEEGEEKEAFIPIKKDALFGVVTIPKDPSSDEEAEEEFEDEDADAEVAEPQEVDPEAEAEAEREVEMALKKPMMDSDIEDDDPVKKKIPAWNTAVVNAVYKKHSVVSVRSTRWPGAVAFAAEGGKNWGVVYLGNGLKSSDYNFCPPAAPLIQFECKDLVEVMDPTAANEKLVIRGEEPKEDDSELEVDEEENEM
eukprot:Tbor_TRINITY_DN5318_c0_g2::TRINITY_DN5318_c0_g2_i1::g.4689::m.4689/K19756/RSPH4A; radial spoke head protein 4A